MTSTWLDFTLNVETGWFPVYTGDGNLYFTFNKNVGPEVTLDVTFEHNASAVTEKDKWKAEGGRLIRLLFTGSTFTTAGTSFSVATMRVDLAGFWESFDKIGEQDGNDVVQGTFRSEYNSNSSSFAQIDVVLAQAAVA